MRPLENRCCADSEIHFALIAAVEATLASGDALTTGASRAGCPIRPKAGLKVNPRCLLVGEHCEKLEGRNCALAHGLIVDNSLKGVKYYYDVFALIFQPFRVRGLGWLATAQSQDTAVTISMKGVKIMDILQYLPAAQVADLRAMSKVAEELKKLDLKTVPLDLSSFTYDRALLTHIR
jgi:hypothetical protein